MATFQFKKKAAQGSAELKGSVDKSVRLPAEFLVNCARRYCSAASLTPTVPTNTALT